MFGDPQENRVAAIPTPTPNRIVGTVAKLAVLV
jgi:hypothetical protein